jgi:hypothetical protein
MEKYGLKNGAGDGRAQTWAHKKTAFPEGKTRFHGRYWITTDEWVVPPAGIAKSARGRINAKFSDSSATAYQQKYQHLSGLG